MEGTQEELVPEMVLHIIKGLPCMHSNEQALKIASKGVRVGMQIPQLRVILFIFLKRETSNIILKGVSLLALPKKKKNLISSFPFPLLS